MPNEFANEFDAMMKTVVEVKSGYHFLPQDDDLCSSSDIENLIEYLFRTHGKEMLDKFGHLIVED